MLALTLLFPFGVSSVSALTDGVKRHALLIITLVGSVLLGTVSLQTILSSARDNAAMRAAKHLAQTVLPVVGGTVSASLSTLWGGLALTKSIIGTGGILVIIGTLIGPLVSLLIYKLAIGIITAAERFLSVSSSLPRISECLDMLIGIYSVSAVIYVFEIVLFINGGVNLS
jgi:stage III sporulation protein AE